MKNVPLAYIFYSTYSTHIIKYNAYIKRLSDMQAVQYADPRYIHSLFVLVSEMQMCSE